MALNYQVFNQFDPSSDAAITEAVRVSVEFDGEGTFSPDGALVDGCTDETACNYDSGATSDDGSCEYVAAGDAIATAMCWMHWASAAVDALKISTTMACATVQRSTVASTPLRATTIQRPTLTMARALDSPTSTVTAIPPSQTPPTMEFVTRMRWPDVKMLWRAI